MTTTTRRVYREYGLYDGKKVHAVGYFTTEYVRAANKALRSSRYRWMLGYTIPRAMRLANEIHEKEIRTAVRKERMAAHHTA